MLLLRFIAFKFLQFIFLKDFIYLFLERGREGEREKHQCVVASHVAPIRNLAHNPGMCPDWESSRQHFGSQPRAQSTEPHQPGPHLLTLNHTNAVGGVPLYP